MSTPFTATTTGELTGIKIKIYDKDFSVLTTLFGGVLGSDFTALKYKNSINKTGDCSFTVRMDNVKITPETVQHYNRIEVTDIDDTVRWVGYIIDKQYDLYTIDIKCYQLINILQKRLTSASQTLNGNASTLITSLINTTNSAEATGITLGTLDISTSINQTANRTAILSVINTIADTVGGQYFVDNNRNFQFQSQVGSDLSASVFFRYNINQLELANILSFNITDSGKEIVSKTYGKAGAITSVQESAGLRTAFGLIEEFQNYREQNNATTLDNITAANNKTSIYVPDLRLAPSLEDNFEAGDVVQIELDNGFISLIGTFQIFQKSVEFRQGQKSITISIDESAINFIDDITKLKQNVSLLNRNV